MENIQLNNKDTDSVNQFVKIEKAELENACNQVFDSMVTRGFLHSLSKCNVKPLSTTSGYSKVRWYRIDKIVIEKDVFFADKLSMLYMSLHKTAKNIILVLNKQDGGDIELYLGARDFSGKSSVSGKILEAGLEGYFPGIKFQKKNIKDLKFSDPAISSVSAIASLRDDKKEDFVQGIERLINATSSIRKFRAYFVADSVSDVEANGMINAFNNLYSSLSPAEMLQMTFNESETKGVSESFTENFSESIGESISKTVTHQEGYSENSTESDTRTDGNSENHSRNIATSFWNGIKGGRTGGGINHSKSSTLSKSIGKNFSDSEANQKGSNRNTSKGTANQKSSNKSTTKGTSKQITYKNRTVKFYLDVLDKQLERLQNGRPFGLWSVATYFVANDPTTVQQLSNIYRGSIIGEESGLETCAINTWTDGETVKEINNYLTNSLHPRFDFNSLDVSAGSVVNSKELAIHLSLPQSSVPGIIVQERASFARNVFSNKKNGNKIRLGKIIHLGKKSYTPVNLDVDELTKHLFVTGSTGSGKSNTMYLIIQELLKKGKKLLIIEPAKGEYKNIFGNGFWYSQGTNDNKEEIHIPIKVYGSNPRVSHLLRINPFAFPKRVHVYEHIDRLVEIFNACWPMYAAMPVVLKKAITDAYVSCGWNLYKSEWNIDNDVILYPTFDDVVIALRTYINDSEYSSDTKSDYKGSIETRLLSLTEGLSGEMLNKPLDSTLQDSDLFEDNVIIDLSTIGNSETKSLIMGLLVMKMSEYYQSQNNMNSELKHVTILEEAHNLLKRTSKEQFQEGSNITGKSVEMITNSIAEMRTYGEGFIIVDQSPSMVDEAAIRNTNTKIIMSLPEVGDRTIAGKSIGLSDKQIEEISRQKVGQAIVFQNNWEEPVQCMICDFNSSHNDCRMDPGVFKDPEEYDDINYKECTRIIIKYLYNCCHKEQKFDCERIDLKKAIINSRCSSNLKYSLLKHANKDLASNQDELDGLEHAQIMELVAHCIGKIKNISKIISNKDNIDDINNTLRICIQDEFPNESEDFYLFCIRCSFRLQASLSKSAIEKYNNWFNKYCY